MTGWFYIKWCDLFHGGGQVTRDPYGRINWCCSKCGRWSLPVDKLTEKLITESAIRARMEQKQ